jgi:exodeoxyribonuclease VII large subunit
MRNRSEMRRDRRVDLLVPFAEKEYAKARGARWDHENQTWYAPPGANLRLLTRWLPRLAVAVEDEADEPAEALPVANGTAVGVELSDLLAGVKEAIENALPELVWVRAEVTELRAKNGHLYLTLAQRDDAGNVLAQARAIVWKNRAVEINARFEQATGEGLRADIKILCLARVRFDVLYGLSLMIEDLDPAFTLGDLAAKLARIREELQRTGLYTRNQALPSPQDFVRVAVISPETSAGLGDFRREADRLAHGGLCEFRFFEATFQGKSAPGSVSAAIKRALEAHRDGPFDALVIIRGGGSVADLAWLNDLELAKLAALAPIPVITGIGHERDSTILDEIAQRRFDTPSKVALYISTTIRAQAFGALQSLDRIKAAAARILVRERATLDLHSDRIRSSARAMLRLVASQLNHFKIAAQTSARGSLHLAALALENERRRISEQAEGRLRDELRVIDALAQTIWLAGHAVIAAAEREVGSLRDQVVRESGRMTAGARDEIERARTSLSTGVPAQLASARRDLEHLARIIVGLGPEATLERGFAIARDLDHRPLASRKAATENASFRVQFRDGILAVDNKDFAGGRPT